MRLFFLDVVDAGVSDSVDKALLLVLAATIVVEAIVMLIGKYNPFGRTLWQSAVANIASVLVGYLLIRFAPGLFDEYTFGNLAVLLLITVAVELGVLYLLNRGKRFLYTLLICLLMNVITYLLFYLFIQISDR